MIKKARKRSHIMCSIIPVLGCAAITLALCTAPLAALGETVTFTQTEEPLNNPLTGYAPNARDVTACADSQLVFILLTWASWEPTEGAYDIAGLEARYNIARWKAEGKHAVLRFVCDIPGGSEHLDIPKWLYDRTGDGVYYSNSYGKGYSPNYANAFLRERHAMAVQALAAYCNRDAFVSYVELGSLGHWGEWHTNTAQGVGPMPDAEVCRQYVQDYTTSFSNARLMTRRNYSIAVDEGLGVYNDMAGDTRATQLWLGWLKNGGSYKTEGKALNFTPVQRFWEYAPVGGELTSDRTMDELLGIYYSDTLATVEQGHMTFIGPNCPVWGAQNRPAAVALRERLGYRLYISELRTSYSLLGNSLNVYLTWNNVGLAPLYWDWPVTMYVYDGDGNPIYSETLAELKLSTLVPDKPITVLTQIPYTDTLEEGFQIGIGITSPDSRDHIRLAMESETYDNYIQIIYTYALD